MTLLSIHCQPSTADHRCSGSRTRTIDGVIQAGVWLCFCACHFPESARTWECHHAPRLDGRSIPLPTPMQLRSWANRARFSLVHPGRLP